MKLADNTPRVGDWVLAVGNPFGLGGTVTAGIVSARGRDIGAGPYDDFIQIDAPVNKGNSGGPTFDVDGNVIGVNTAIYSPSGGSVGIAFAIPADTVKSVITQLREKGSVTRGWIGVQIQPVTPDIADSMGLKQATGALVAEPQPNSPAVKAGIQSGDVITSVNGNDGPRRAPTCADDRHHGAGHLGHARSDPQRAAEDRDADARHAAERERGLRRTELEPRAWLGHRRAEARLFAGARRAKSSEPSINGVVVTAIAEGGVAADHGLQVGDVILDVGGKPVSTPADVNQGLSDARKEGKHTVLFRVKSGGDTKFVALPLGNA